MDKSKVQVSKNDAGDSTRKFQKKSMATFTADPDGRMLYAPPQSSQ